MTWCKSGPKQDVVGYGQKNIWVGQWGQLIFLAKAERIIRKAFFSIEKQDLSEVLVVLTF